MDNVLEWYCKNMCSLKNAHSIITNIMYPIPEPQGKSETMASCVLLMTLLFEAVAPQSVVKNKR